MVVTRRGGWEGRRRQLFVRAQTHGWYISPRDITHSTEVIDNNVVLKSSSLLRDENYSNY